MTTPASAAAPPVSTPAIPDAADAAVVTAAAAAVEPRSPEVPSPLAAPGAGGVRASADGPVSIRPVCRD